MVQKSEQSTATVYTAEQAKQVKKDLSDKIADLFVPCTRQLLFTRIYGFEPNPAIRGAVDTSTERTTSLRVNSRKHGVLFSGGGFVAIIKRAKTGGYDALTSLSMVDGDMYPTGGRILDKYVGLDMIDPTELSHEHVFHRLRKWDGAPEPVESGLLDYDFDTAGVVLGQQMIAGIKEITAGPLTLGQVGTKLADLFQRAR